MSSAWTRPSGTSTSLRDSSAGAQPDRLACRPTSVVVSQPATPAAAAISAPNAPKRERAERAARPPPPPMHGADERDAQRQREALQRRRRRARRSPRGAAAGARRSPRAYVGRGGRRSASELIRRPRQLGDPVAHRAGLGDRAARGSGSRPPRCGRRPSRGRATAGARSRRVSTCCTRSIGTSVRVTADGPVAEVDLVLAHLPAPAPPAQLGHDPDRGDGRSARAASQPSSAQRAARPRPAAPPAAIERDDDVHERPRAATASARPARAGATARAWRSAGRRQPSSTHRTYGPALERSDQVWPTRSWPNERWRLLADEREPRALVDPAGVRRACRWSTARARGSRRGGRSAMHSSDEPGAEAEPARPRLDEQQPQLGDGVGLAHAEHAAGRRAVDLGDPDRLARRVRRLGEVGDDRARRAPRTRRSSRARRRRARRCGRIDPAEVAGPRRAQDDRAARAGRGSSSRRTSASAATSRGAVRRRRAASSCAPVSSTARRSSSAAAVARPPAVSRATLAPPVGRPSARGRPARAARAARAAGSGGRRRSPSGARRSATSSAGLLRELEQHARLGERVRRAAGSRARARRAGRCRSG